MSELAAEVVRLVHASFQRQGVLIAWQARLTRVALGAVEIELPMSALVTQQHGYFHGGVIGALADSAGGYAAHTVLLPEQECLTAEYKINFLRPAAGQLLVARGSLLKSGHTLVVARAEVFVRNHGVEKMCAVLQQTMFAVPAAAELPSGATAAI